MLTIVSTGSVSISGSELGSAATTRDETSVVVMISTSNSPMLFNEIGSTITIADRNAG